MAGGGDRSENPVAINVVPMVDVIFCLCVFFMCSFKFKQLEGRFDTWLPKDKGSVATPGATRSEIRVALFWDADTHRVARKFGARAVRDDAELSTLLRGAHVDLVQQGHPDAPAIIDAAALVPWGEIVTVVDLCKSVQIEHVEFALGKPN